MTIRLDSPCTLSTTCRHTPASLHVFLAKKDTLGSQRQQSGCLGNFLKFHLRGPEDRCREASFEKGQALFEFKNLLLQNSNELKSTCLPAYPELNQTLLPSCCYKSPGTFCWTSPATSITKTIHFLVNIYISKSQKGFFFVKSHHPLHPSPHPLHPSQLLNRLLAFPIFGDRRPFHPSRLGCQERPRWRSGGEVLRPSDWETSGPCWVCVFFWLANPLFGKWFDWWRSPRKKGVFKKVDGGLIFKSFKGATHVTKAYPAVTPEGVL